MRGLRHGDVPRAVHLLAQSLHELGRAAELVLGSADIEGPGSYLGQSVFQIEAEKGRRDPHVSLERRAADHLANILQHLRVRGLEFLREPALHGRLDDRLESLLLYRAAQLVPHRREVGNHARAATARDEALDPAWVFDRKRLRDRAAEAEAYEGSCSYSQLVQKSKQVLDQERDAVVAPRRRAAPMAAQVVAQDTEIGCERRDLPVPHREVVGNAGDEGHPARAAAIDAVMGPDQGKMILL